MSILRDEGKMEITIKLTTEQKAINGEIAQYFKDMSWDRIDQTAGNYSETCGSCVGSHMYNFFGLNFSHVERSNFFYGAGHWAKLMGFEDFRDPAIYNLFSNVGLTICGASERPFDIKQWNLHPHEVFKRLSE